LSRFVALCVAGMMYLTGATTLYGASLTGAEDPKFLSALYAWLEGNDDEALHSLASLARAENRAAQVFLGQIESKLWLHSHVTGDLARKERIELMRNPQGLSGKSWLASAASDTPLAQHFLDANLPYRSPENGLALFAEGELDSALPLIARASTVGDFVGALELALANNAIPYSSGFVRNVVRDLPRLVESGLVSLNDPRFPEIQRRLDLVPVNAPGAELLWGSGGVITTPRDFFLPQAELQSIGNTLMGVPGLQPVTLIIQRHCPREVADALAALQMASYGRPLTLITFSPVETVLPTPDYQKSARFEADILRRMWFSVSKVIVQNLNKCAFSMIAHSSQ